MSGIPEALRAHGDRWLAVKLPCPHGSMAHSALECPDGVCHSHHGGHAVARAEVEHNRSEQGSDWCERLAERIDEIAVDSFCQTVMPDLHQQGWQRRHLDWAFKLSAEPAEVERTVVEGTIKAIERFRRSREVQCCSSRPLVQATIAEASDHSLRGQGIRYLIDAALMTFLVWPKTGRICSTAWFGGDWRTPAATWRGAIAVPATT